MTRLSKIKKRWMAITDQSIGDAQADVGWLVERVEELRDALEPLAGQDCDWWWCEHAEGDTDACEPAAARMALRKLEE